MGYTASLSGWWCVTKIKLGREYMIVYYKLDSLLENKGMKKIDLQRKLGISPSTMANFSKNKYVAMSIIDKICKELQCQPGDIMEWVDDDCAEIASIDAQIAELQARKKELQGNQIHLHNNDARVIEEHNISEKKIVHKVSENIRRQSIETLKVRKESLEYLRTNGFKTIDDVIDRQNEIPTEIRGNIYAYLIFGMGD